LTVDLSFSARSWMYHSGYLKNVSLRCQWIKCWPEFPRAVFQVSFAEPTNWKHFWYREDKKRCLRERTRGNYIV